ncbi:MAG: hypothetical protein EP301_03500, partial [Gammaproteobacteria bacterium]
MAKPPRHEVEHHLFSLRHVGPKAHSGILCLAGFGDDSTMYLPLLETSLAASHRFVRLDFPGFGEEPP